MRNQVTPITLYPIPFNQGLPGFGRRGLSPLARLLSPAVRSELARNGWAAEDVASEGFVLRKRVDGYQAKAYVVHVHCVDNDLVQAQGELTLHSMTCARTSPAQADRAHLAEKLWPVLDATEALTVFGDDADF